MVRSLWTAASGMIGQQANIDTISNNLANVNTSGFKRMRADFEDLIYQTVRYAGTPATEDTVVPVPIQMGHGSKLSATQRQFTQGALQNTENVTLNFLFWTFTWPLWLFSILMALFGALVWFGLGVMRRHRRRQARRDDRRA